jgi:DNA-binding CsgD family transcriptional regulator
MRALPCEAPAGDEPAKPLADRCSPRSEIDGMRLSFGLSPRQAKLASLLLSGRSVKEAAHTLSITEGSARQYLKVIFRKTGACRQSDLIRIVHSALAS